MSLAAIRSVWRRLLPTRARRFAQPLVRLTLESYVRTISRRDRARPPAADGPIRIVGLFSDTHGIAASARLAARAFEALGAKVERVDVSGSRLSWSGRLERPTPAAAWIFHLNPPELMAGLACLGPRQVVGPRYGYWAYELPSAPRRWLADGALVDEIWAPSRYTARALEGAAAPVRVVPHPLFPEDYARIEPAPREAGFLAVCLFDFNSSVARKNPQGAIAAFRQAFGDDPSARLVIKTQNGLTHPQALAELRASAPDNVEIVDASWPYGQVMRLIRSADALVSLHRAEGFGLPFAEAMALGVPVVATGFSGNLDFMDEESALLIPATPAPVDDPQGIYRGQSWGEPDIAAAAQALRALRDDPQLRARLSRAGRARVESTLSPRAWFRTLPQSVQAAAIRAGAKV